MQLFDIVKLIFSNKPKDWSSIGRIDKSRNFFMVNRIMSIQFPVQANQFNKLKVVPHHVVDWWHNTLSARFSRPPQWLFTKTNKNSGKDQEDIKYNEKVEDFIKERYRRSNRDLETLKRFYPDKYRVWVEDLSDQMGIQK